MVSLNLKTLGGSTSLESQTPVQTRKIMKQAFETATYNTDIILASNAMLFEREVVIFQTGCATVHY